MSLRVLFLGAGATGGYFGAHLLQAKKQGAAIDVAFLVREKRAQQLASDGLRIIGSEGDDQCYEAPFISVKNNNKTDPWDIIILTCKAYDLPSAIETIRPYIEEKTVVLPLLNGVAHFPILEKELGIEKILAGNCHINVALRDDGAIVQMTKLVRITYGLYRDHATSSDAFARGQAVLTQLHKVFQTCPIDARFSNHIMQDIWEKYLFLASLAGLTCLMRGSIGAIMASQEGEAIALEFLQESIEVATHLGYPPRAEELKLIRHNLTQKGSVVTSSLLRDIEKGGLIEADHLIGDIYRKARDMGLKAPLLRLAWAHLQTFESRFLR